jgi:prolyl 4-hydroxylase
MSLDSGQQQEATPQLQAWLQSQIDLGHSTRAMLKAMEASGWEAGLARKLVSDALEAPAKHRALPGPDLSGAASTLEAGDRPVELLLTLQRPRVMVFGDLLSAQECSSLIEAARPRLQRSLTVEVKSGGEELSADRTSQGMFFARGETPLVRRVEERIARLLNWPMAYGEGLQILRYGPGAQYKPHYDYFDPAEPGTPAILKRGGQRVATLIMYLASPEQGGATVFPDIGLDVAPQRGNAVFFSYDRPDPSI